MADPEARRLRVLQLLADPARSAHPVENPYTSSLVASLPEGRIETRYFHWRDAVSVDADVVHMHWPENSLRHPRLLGRLAKRAMFLVLLCLVRWRRIAVVRTVHNVRPHEAGGQVEGWILRRLDAQTTLWVTLNEATPTRDRNRTMVIPHGHYRDRQAGPSPESVPGRLLHFGMLKPYKGVEELLSAFASIPEETGYRLRVVGESRDDALARRVQAAAEGDSRIQIDLRFVEEAELASEVGEAEVIVLPYRAMENSGSALLALSLHRPVLLPDSASTRLLQAEFGREWVGVYAGTLDAASLHRGVDDLRHRRRDPSGPDMSGRDWEHLGGMLAAAYERAAHMVGRA